ncbi:hypothetical protein [Halorientalis regularis]|uniref:hypothetical protein n=1 Tax=Halorientalis regularis TaxID=660518 RepID=UPI0011142A3F|nr:hypothetical protein [Halorientalis regularis]
MKQKEELLEEYNKPNQDTKRAIIEYLYRNPDTEHETQEVFEAVKNDCRAGKVGTVANQLSQLSNNEDRIGQEERSYYRWEGEGQRRPNRRLYEVKLALEQWIDSLGISTGTLIVAFFIWFLGILCAIISLVPLFTPINPLGVDFVWWFRISGLLTILGSTTVMIWIPLYLFDVWQTG